VQQNKQTRKHEHLPERKAWCDCDSWQGQTKKHYPECNAGVEVFFRLLVLPLQLCFECTKGVIDEYLFTCSVLILQRQVKMIYTTYGDLLF
jgi:hypothetical protein